MPNLRLFATISGVSVPTLMYGGYALLGAVKPGDLTPFQHTYFRTGHAQAGILMLLSVLFYRFLKETRLGQEAKLLAAVAGVAGILGQAGGFIIHLAIGHPGAPSIGTAMTISGALLLAGAVFVLAYGLISAE